MQQPTGRPEEDAQEERETAKPVKPIPLLHGGGPAFVSEPKDEDTL
jgi:hypothetical protein